MSGITFAEAERSNKFSLASKGNLLRCSQERVQLMEIQKKEKQEQQQKEQHILATLQCSRKLKHSMKQQLARKQTPSGLVILEME